MIRARLGWIALAFALVVDGPSVPWAEAVDSELVILSPRQTRVLASQVKFVWTGGPETGKTSVRVLGPSGFQWTTEDAHSGMTYPDSAPKLMPGVRYRWEVRIGNTRSEREHFEIVSDQEWARIRAQLAGIDSSDGPTTGTLARVALLFQERLYQTALEELQTGIAGNPTEPNLQFMLGHVYDRMGLREQAKAAFAAAQKLSTD